MHTTIKYDVDNIALEYAKKLMLEKALNNLK